ncbi:hypothetical protein P43SY_005634 [Pythium insidiosum]|uniref:WASH complex subunit FAM21 n=1 Tax=Pythium insidiosum TaxID=114742 RepID=A0AAD5Q4R8_PYTIN|nr:hypothetical protein P43SY_005634 [Pythium insidiosum]KAJ0403983.1 hypothetical protein ATCC90586_010023 [Pythium insidiosum]
MASEVVSDADTGNAPPAARSSSEALQALAKEVNKWTLHSDRELHLFLKSYSAELFERTKTLENQVRDVAMEADAAHVRLRNTFNQFLMLSNNQFIENRVYDEEQGEEFGAETVNAPTTATGEENASGSSDPATASTAAPETAADSNVKEKSSGDSVVTKYRSALEKGLEAMKLFATLDDDESDTSSQFDTVLDIYNERPLPFIIGTREFLEDETLGLGAPPDDDDDSDSVSSDDSESEYGSSYSSSDESEVSEAPQREASRSKPRASSADSDSSGGLFGRPTETSPKVSGDHAGKRESSASAST